MTVSDKTLGSGPNLGPILSAERCPAKFGVPKTSRLNLASANGIRYERRVSKALTILAINNDLILESQPWFVFSSRRECSTPPEKEFCAPDFILSPLDRSWFLILEVKQTFYDLALDKLEQLYLSVVGSAYQKPVNGILICKTLIPGAPKPIDSLRGYKPFIASVYHYPELGPLVW